MFGPNKAVKDELPAKVTRKKQTLIVESVVGIRVSISHQKYALATMVWMAACLCLCF